MCFFAFLSFSFFFFLFFDFFRFLACLSSLNVEEDEEDEEALAWETGCTEWPGAGATEGGISSSESLAAKTDTNSSVGRGRLGADLFQC